VSPQRRWMSSLCGLISLLTYLSVRFVTAKQFPSINLTFTREKQLRLPIITVCPSFLDATLFPRGATALGKGLPPLVTVSEVHLPVPSSSQMRVIKYPQSLSNVEEVILGGGLRSPKSCAQNLSPNTLNRMQSVVSTSSSGGPCSSCLRFGLLEPVNLKPGRRQKVILNAAVNRLWTACQHDDPSGSSHFDDNVITWFIEVVASGLNKLREMKYLTDPESALPREEAGRDFICNTLRQRVIVPT
jgi:hypothetical protein